MALNKCKECGNEVSTKAEACPKCGAIQKKKTSCLGCLGAVILILITLGVIGSLIEDKPNKTGSSKVESSNSRNKKIYKEGDTVHIGYTSYAVWSSRWSSKLSDNKFLDEQPDAMFLFINLTVRNDDKKARTIPPFKLIDENGAEYETSSKGWAVKDSLGLLESLNPDVSKQGILIFDVPKNHDYKLEVSGGYWSSEDAFIKINPK